MEEKVKKFIKEHKKFVAGTATLVVIAGSVYIFSGTEAGYNLKGKIADACCRSIVKRNGVDWYITSTYRRSSADYIREALIQFASEL